MIDGDSSVDLAKKSTSSNLGIYTIDWSKYDTDV